MFPGTLGHSLAGRALETGLWAMRAIDIRQFATDRHRSVDGTPAGGGPGMVLRADILAAALDEAAREAPGCPHLVMTPRGTPLTQARVRALAAGPGAVVLCGRFEGMDERVIAGRGLEEISVGDAVLSGGEPAALLMLDACVRLLPGVMGDDQSGSAESFENDLLEYPQFTRPALFEGHPIPDVLLSGDHKRVAAWRRAEARRLTRERRPDLWERHVLQADKRDTGGSGGE
jgi:tRNA (guanine37-N1)-methyltransferase